ncbi:MAG: C4-dicarboxylate ABC transporter substrate-binding protein, partial [Microvirga sp.]
MLARRHLIIGLLGAAALAVQAIPAAAQVKWDLSTVWPETNFHTQNARRFADEVKKATNGAVEITVKSGGQLGFKGPEHLRAVRDG